MNKQHFNNYFRGYKNKFRDKLFKDGDEYYCTNLVSIVKLYSSYGLDYTDETSRLKDYVDMFDNEYELYGYTDLMGHIFDMKSIPNMDFCCDPRKIEKVQLLVKGCMNAPRVVKRKDRDQYAIKIDGDYGYGYILPIRNY